MKPQPAFSINNVQNDVYAPRLTPLARSRNYANVFMSLKKNNVTLLYDRVRALHIQIRSRAEQRPAPLEAVLSLAQPLLWCWYNRVVDGGHKVRLILVQSLTDSRNRRVSRPTPEFCCIRFINKLQL